MKNKIATMAAIVGITAVLSGCGNNGQTFKYSSYKFDRAQIKMIDGSVAEGKVLSWGMAEGTDLVCVVLDDGCRYLTNVSNIVLIKDIFKGTEEGE